MIRPARTIRCKRFLAAGRGGAIHARWEALASPPPVESDEDFERRLRAAEHGFIRARVVGVLTLALACTCLAYYVQLF